MSGHGHDGPTVAAGGEQVLVEQADVAAAVCVQAYSASGGLDEAPAQISVDMGIGVAENRVAAAGINPGHESGIAGQVFGARAGICFSQSSLI